MNTPPSGSRLTEDAAFVLSASVHRDARLTRCVFRSAGQNPKLPGDTLYLFDGGADVDGMSLALAISAPDVLVTARDAVGLRNIYLMRDAEYHAGGPWWIRPLGVPLADRAAAHVVDLAPSASPCSSSVQMRPVAPEAPLVQASNAPIRRARHPNLVRDLRKRVGAKLELWNIPDCEGRVYGKAVDVTLSRELNPAQKAAQRVDLDARRARMGLPARPVSTLAED